MRQIAPAGPVYQAGTLSGNPLAMAAGIATLDALAVPGTWHLAEQWADRATAALAREAERVGVPLLIHRVGTMFTPFFTTTPVTDYATARLADREAYKTFFHQMLAGGVYLAPSPFEAAFTSAVHDDDALDRWTRACAAALQQVQEVRDSWQRSQ
jgi:glutamate-1-semialdehyde 2,1-aminomutase